ncbi:hypothetical protein LG047_07165 [Methylocystis sp. WRRC1]|uniref:hypothetical protein n=1 Tax=Methylocystis sp. WRRC1 TaxID=1732014 RepID=UPI001D138C80|nr:hypothetical protein [Methylocystis sp. WRRC1]MCC3245097.1 hypothetical protein [Methylocystis sp. WRRC1]
MSALRKPMVAEGGDSAALRTQSHEARPASERVDYRVLRMRALIGIQECLRVAENRIASGTALNWHNLAYCWAVPVLMFPARVYKITKGKHAHKYQREYFATWPDATAKSLLVELGIANPEPWIVEAVQSGIDKARRRRVRGFVNADTAARMIGVDRAERENLQLRTIGAIDFLKADRAAAATERRKARDKKRRAAARVAAGARPRSQSYSAVKPWAAFGESRASFYRRPKEEREQMLKHVIGEPETNSSPPISPKGINRPADEVVSATVVEFPLARRTAQRAPGVDRETSLPASAGGGRPPSARPDGHQDRLEWWAAPVPGWPETLTIRNIVTDAETTIRLQEGGDD